MRNAENVFHLAIPCKDLDETEEFCGDLLQCRIARRYDDRVTLDFFGDQVVCHLAPEDIDPEPRLYPRHFGLTFKQENDFDSLLRRARTANIPFFRDPFVRFEGRPEEHRTFFLIDPANNLIEFKHYRNSEMMY